MRKSIFNKEKAKRLRVEGMSYGDIAKHIEGATKITIWRFLNPDKMDEHRERTKKRQRRIKARLIKHKGGECSICGYNRCQGSLSFHHLIEEDKSFGIGDRKGGPWKELLEETKKTILVCNNCHGEIHAGLHDHIIENENKNRNRL